jgi:hypothetical protein
MVFFEQDTCGYGANFWKNFTAEQLRTKYCPGVARSGAFTQAMGWSDGHEIEGS